MNAPAATTPLDGSRLCRACGLCCQGVLHDRVRVDPGEVSRLELLGLRVYQSGETSAFDLPCPHHRDDSCQIYENRPASCRGYRCKLLGRHLSGEVGLEEGLRIVARTREQLSTLRSLVPDDQQNVWPQIQARASEDPELMLAAAALLALVQRHFKTQTEPKRLV